MSAPPVDGCKVGLTQYIHRHVGRPALIMGGGPSLPWQVTPFFGGVDVTDDFVLFSANQHGCVLRDQGMVPRVDYVLAVDNIETKKLDRAGNTLRSYGVPIVSIRMWADIRMFSKPVATSGMCAAYVAWVMGCSPIVLAGMDCYDGGTYWWDERAESTGHRMQVKAHVKRWQQLLEKADGMFRTMGGPTERVFPRYDPTEPPAPRGDYNRIFAQMSGTPVRFLRDELFGQIRYRRNTIAEMSKSEARKLVRQGKAEFVKREVEAA